MRDSLGGDVVVSMLAALNFPSPLPAMRAAGMHGQLFLNGGNIMLLGGSGKSLRDCWQDFTTSFRWSVVGGEGEALVTWRRVALEGRRWKRSEVFVSSLRWNAGGLQSCYCSRDSLHPACACRVAWRVL